MSELVSFLRQVDIFSLLTVKEIENIIGSLHTIEYGKGEIIFNEGEKGNTLFIVKSGMVEASVQIAGGMKRKIADFRPGDFFGEMSIFEHAPRSAACYTVEKSSLITLPGDEFNTLINKNPFTAIKIMYSMLHITTQRLREKSEFLTEMVLWGEEARKRAITDQLTGVFNRRFLEDALKEYYLSSKKHRKPLSLIMADLDHFRTINDHYSPEMGDKVLIWIVKALKKCLREDDIIARYGGDEFSVILSETRSDAARIIAENIRYEVAKLKSLKKISLPKSKVTISLGIASYPENAEDLKTLKNKADQALYRAKNEGRNRVISEI